MKYLKSFNESLDKNIIQDLEDICQELKDEGFTINIDNNSAQQFITIYKKIKYGYKWFTYKDIEDVFLRIQDYIKQQGYYAEIKLNNDKSYKTWCSKVKTEDEKTYCDFIWIIIQHGIKLSNTPITEHQSTEISDEEILKDVSEICYDLTDEDQFKVRGFSFGANPVFNDLKFRSSVALIDPNDHQPKRKKSLFIHIQKKLNNHRQSRFYYSEIEEVVERLKDYMSSLGFKFTTEFSVGSHNVTWLDGKPDNLKAKYNDNTGWTAEKYIISGFRIRFTKLISQEGGYIK